MNELSKNQAKIQAARTSSAVLFLAYAGEPTQSNTCIVPMALADETAGVSFATYALLTQPIKGDASSVTIAPLSAIPPQDSGQGPTGWQLGEWLTATFATYGEALAFYAGNSQYPIGGGSFVQLSTQQRDTACLISTLAPNPETGPPLAYVVLYQEMSVHAVLP